MSAGTALAAAIGGCTASTIVGRRSDLRVMTVLGWIDADELGFTLTHEHLYVDFRSWAEQRANVIAVDQAEVMAVLAPKLAAIRRLGCATLVDATAVGLGRNPAIVRAASQASGIHMLTATGNYLAADRRFEPDYVATDSVQALADRWIGEWDEGIEGSGVRPGFIKLSLNGGPLFNQEPKLIEAAAIAHKATGLTIGTHVGWGENPPLKNATAAFAAIDGLAAGGVAGDAFIWIHAQNEPMTDRHVEAARRGAFVSFDGFRPGQEQDYLTLIGRMRDAGVLDRVLVSQDAGWYTAGEPQGGDFSPFDPLQSLFLPAMRSGGFGDVGIATVFIDNPARALAVRKRVL